MTRGEWAARTPWTLLACAAGLLAMGLLAIARAEDYVGAAPDAWRKQLVWAGLSLFAAAAAAGPHYRLWRSWSYVLLAAALAALVLVFFFPPINGARRWIRLGPLSLQPSEFAKLALILCLARWMMYRDGLRRLPSMAPPILFCLAPMLLILKEPDLGTALVFPPLVLAVLLAAGARWRDVLKLALAAGLLTPVVWLNMSREQRSRVTALWESTDPGARPSDDAYHLYHAKQTLALGGLWGSWLDGPAVDDPNVYRLPAAQTDFIFTVLGERFGVPGLMLVVLLYIGLVGRTLAVAAATREPFGRLLAVGVAALWAVQMLINTAMTVGLAPITGLALPWVSYGDRRVVANAVALGLVVNVGLRPGADLTREPFRFQDE